MTKCNGIVNIPVAEFKEIVELMEDMNLETCKLCQSDGKACVAKCEETKKVDYALKEMRKTLG